MVELDASYGARDKAGKNFLLLQLPCGEFGRELQTSLIRAGHKCRRIVFNGGDLIGALGQDFVSYRKSAAEWPTWIEDYARSHGVTDIVCYGDCRPYHCAAIDVLRPRGVRIHVLEEGYLRPNWITYEPDGVNGFSVLTAIDVHELPDKAEIGKESEFPSSFLRYCWLGFLYYFWAFALRPAFPDHVSHRDLGAVEEAMLWLRRLASLPIRRRRLRQLSTAIDQLKKPVHLVLLQLNGDSQVKVHSDFRSVGDFVKLCISEFAASGAVDSLLVFKNHPLDNGVIPLRRLISQEAEQNGVAGRVLFADGGNLVSLLERSVSAISINSTACHQALRRGIPTLLLGRSVFNHALIVSRMPMREFFNLRPQKNRADYDRLISYIVKTSQINGGFYGGEGIAVLIPRLIDRLTRDRGGEQYHPQEASPATERPIQQDHAVGA